MQSQQLGTTRAVLLDTPAAAVTAFVAPQQLLADWSGQAQPVEVALSQNLRGTDNETPPSDLPIYCGYTSSAGQTMEPQFAGFFKIEYGCGAEKRVRFVDLRSARLFLGYCDNVRVTAARWRGTTIPTYPAHTISASATIGQSRGGAYDELVCTHQVYYEAGDAIGQVAAAPAANYAVEVGASEVSGVNMWGSTMPDLFFRLASESARINPAGSSVVPPYRRLMGFSGLYSLSGSGVAVTDMRVTIRFYLHS